jgi:glycosyltransferase involved in cell wall biosynthesis
MTRIVHIIDEMKVGGAQTHLLTMLRYLRKNHQFQHHVISLFGDGIIADQLRDLGVEVIILDCRDELRRKRFDLAVNQIRVQLKRLRPDLVEAHLTWSRLLGLLAARIAGVPKRIGFEQGDIYLNTLKFRLANYISQFYTQKIVVCSDNLKEWVQKTHRISGQRLNVFHNCVDESIFHSQVIPASDLKSYNTSTNTLFAMVGTLGNGVNKRVDLGIHAVAEARNRGADIALVIVGDGDQRQSLEQLAKELRIQEEVHFLGMRSDVPNVLAACDAFCHAAPFEPFGIVALEAMAISLPVVVPNSGGIQEAVIHGKTGIIYSAMDVSAFAEALITISEDNTRREKMGKEAHNVVLNGFTVKAYIERLYQFYGILN